MIYHVTTERDWKAQKHEAQFIPADYQREGFVHCCTSSQLAGVRERYFKGKAELVLLHLDESKLNSEVKYEASTNDEKFPHVYGPLNRTAIVEVERLMLD